MNPVLKIFLNPVLNPVPDNFLRVYYEEFIDTGGLLLRFNHYKWGGATVIGACSFMKHTRVVVHTWRGEGETVKVEELSHGAVYGKEGHRAIHVFYNNKDHYDALLEIVEAKDLQPAFPQPPPPTYFNFDNAPLGTNPPWQPKRGSGFNAPRPNKKQRPAKETEEEEEDEEEEPVTGLMLDLGEISVATESRHPHRQVEDLIKDRVVLQLKPSHLFACPNLLQKRISTPQQATPTLFTEKISHRKLLYTANFCTEKLGHTEVFTQSWGNFSSQRSCHTQQALTERFFYTLKLLHATNFYTQQTFTHSKFSRKESFTHRTFCTRQTFTHSKLAHTASFTQKSFLHTEVFTQRSPNTEKHVHRGAFSHRSLYTQKLLHTASFHTEKLLHTASFYTQKLFHRVGEVFIHRKLLRTEAFTHSQLLHSGAFSQRSNIKKFLQGRCKLLN